MREKEKSQKDMQSSLQELQKRHEELQTIHDKEEQINKDMQEKKNCKKNIKKRSKPWKNWRFVVKKYLAVLKKSQINDSLYLDEW